MNVELIASQDKNFFWSRIIVITALLMVFGITHLPTQSWMVIISKNYLPLHMILEFVGILVSFAVFTVGWATYKNVRSADILVLSLVCFATGWLDVGHTLSFGGMPDFITPSGANKAITFWLASRMTGSLGFLFLSLAKPPEIKTKSFSFMFLAVASMWVLFWFWFTLFHEDLIPPMFIPGGVGLTRLKLLLEWTTIAISLVSGAVFFYRGVRSIWRICIGWGVLALFLR